ncbi:prepro-urotensin II-beta [Amia ocellicauda]|uniref:prepro-urotensin II-beta n=1 Tax=Amia ocellicauda TaxID=2972642 RepID=UPI003463D2C6
MDSVKIKKRTAMYYSRSNKTTAGPSLTSQRHNCPFFFLSHSFIHFLFMSNATNRIWMWEGRGRGEDVYKPWREPEGERTQQTSGHCGGATRRARRTDPTAAIVRTATMVGKLLLSWALLLTASWPLLAHPITDSSEMSYPGPVSGEEGRAAGPEDFGLSDQTYLSQGGPGGLGYPALLAREGLRGTGYIPREAVKEVLMEKQGRMSPLSRFLGNRKQYRKRGNTSECFWKYCV